MTNSPVTVATGEFFQLTLVPSLKYGFPYCIYLFYQLESYN